MEMILHGVDGLQLNSCPVESSPVVFGKPVKCIQYRQRLLYMLLGIDGLDIAVHLIFLFGVFALFKAKKQFGIFHVEKCRLKMIFDNPFFHDLIKGGIN